VKKLTIAAVLILLAVLSYSQEKNVSENEKLASKIAKESKYYGLIIGINNYREDALPDLDTPITDAEKLYLILTSSYSFKNENIMFLRNPTRADIIMSLDQLTRLVTPDDNVLIFYAGHAFWVPDAQIYYWLPSDASRNNQVNWLSNSRLLDYLKTINSRHTLLIADASFSGSIFKTRGAFPDSNPDLPSLYALPSRKAMTSCSLTDASDNGIFIKYLVQGLTENEDSCLSSEQLFSSFRMNVITNGDAIPQYGMISDTGDQGGDFIFLKSK